MENKQERETVFLRQGLTYGLYTRGGTHRVAGGVCAPVCVCVHMYVEEGSLQPLPRHPTPPSVNLLIQAQAIRSVPLVK